MQKRVAIITGASSGIGKACALAFAEKGFVVVLAARNRVKLVETSEEITQMGGTALVIQTDVSLESDCRMLIDNVIETFGQIDLLINNAGVSMRAIFETLNLDVFRQVMNINFWGTVYCTRYALPYLLQKKGSVIGISSIAGKKGLPGRTGYSASKFAMEGFLESLRIENSRKDLHVMVVCPGFTNTDIRKTAFTADGSRQEESPRDESAMMSPEEVADQVWKGYQRKKRNILLTFDGKFTVWLNKFFPSWVDKMVYNHMAKEPDSPF